MKLRLLLPLFLLLSAAATARTLEVRAGGAYPGLLQAAAAALPGDTILFRSGVYAGGQHIENLQGTAEGWITVMAEGEVIVRGGGNAWQLSDPAYLRIIGFVMEQQTGNGLNIDDGGSFGTPAHHIVIEGCEWRGISATGNNDLLKMSGVDSFEVRNCRFMDGAAGGSMIDMVGCHYGSFIENSFERAGSNAIQSKGGTSDIIITRNSFVNAGQRSLNIGGSTGLDFFRPLNANYEAARVLVYGNTFVGSDAPIAFVGAVNCAVMNNTIYLPSRWAIRILQESTDARFLPCGDNIFANNIVVVNNAGAGVTLNIGPNTAPETFRFTSNLWYNVDNPSWGGPTLPVPESASILRRDPMLTSPPDDLSLRPGSPAIGVGTAFPEIALDHNARPFADPPSIGAYEGRMSSTSVERAPGSTGSIAVVVGPAGDHATATFTLPAAGIVEVSIYDMRGERALSREERREAGAGTLRIPLENLTSGTYLLTIRSGEESFARTIAIRR